MKKIIFILIAFHFQNLFAADTCDPSSSISEKECCWYPGSTSRDETQVLRMKNRAIGECILSVKTKSTKTPERRFIFSNDGRFTVTVDMNHNAKLGTKSYQLFPIGEVPSYLLNADTKNIVIKSASGMNWKFDSNTSLPIAVDNCQIVVNKKYSQKDTGVKLHSCKNHLVIESQSIGEQDYFYPKKNAVIKDSNGKNCTLKYSDLYIYTGQNNDGTFDNQEFKFKSNQKLAQMLKSKCSGTGIDLSPLTQKQSNPEEDFANRKIDPKEEQRVKDLLESGGVE